MMSNSVQCLSVSLWVKAEPFTYGALPVAPHSRLSFNNIKKIVSYAKTKGESGFPRLSYSIWKHIACNKLQLPEDLAWMYFVTYNLVKENVDIESRIKFDEKLARCNTPQEIEHVRNSTTVPTLEFVLFLFTQHLHKINLKSSLVSPTEEWPMRARSPDLESGRLTPTGAKSLDEHSHMIFVLDKLSELLEMLVEPDSYSGGKGAGDLSLSIEAVQALGFLFAGSVDRNRNVLPLHEIALMQPLHQQSGYSKISQSFSFRSLQSWLRSHITQNPFGISSCIANGKRLSWPLAGEERDAKFDSKRGKIATNALLVPKDQMKGNKIIIMSHVCRQTIARSSGTLENSSVKIHRCHNSFLYLLSPLRSVSIEKCRHTTVVLGAVETSIQVNNCESVIVIAACRHLAISGSTLCDLHLCIPTRPLILSGNDTIVLAPYHTYYGNLKDHMKQVGLSVSPNLWDQPLCVGADHQEASPTWELMSPKEFFTFAIPFDIPGTTESNPLTLPMKYEKALKSREQQIENWQHMVKDAGLSRPQRKQFQGLVESFFQDWLADSGEKKQLDGLVVSSKSKHKQQSASS